MNHCKQQIVRMKDLNRSPNGRSYSEWILANGEEFKGRLLSLEEQTDLQYYLCHDLFKLGYCFYNAQIIATGSTKYLYYEGQATCSRFPELPLEHAFLVKDGKVYDPTWQDGLEYFGVHIPTEVVRKFLLKLGRADPWLFSYYRRLKQ